ncbi:unnamed protein product, partial [Rotaria sp. Silwood1]
EPTAAPPADKVDIP